MESLSRLVIGKPIAKLPSTLAKEIRRGTKVMVLADSAVVSRWGKGLQIGLKRAGFEANTAVIPAGERSKTLAPQLTFSVNYLPQQIERLIGTFELRASLLH